MTHKFSPEFLARLPKNAREHRALIRKLGIREPKSGRPRKGERRPTSLHAYRLDGSVEAKARRVIARKGTSIGALTRRVMTDYFLSQSA